MKPSGNAPQGKAKKNAPPNNMMMDELDSAMMMPVEDKKGGGNALDEKRKSLGGGEQFEKHVMHSGKMPSMIHPTNNLDNTQEEQISSSFFNGMRD